MTIRRIYIGQMLTKKIAQLAKAKALVSKLEKTIAADLHKELAGLPAAFGFNDTRSFIAALKASRGTSKKPGRKAKRRRRAVITDAVRAQVKKFAKAGKTGREIAAKVGISLPSVQGIKKTLGLVKSRKARAKKSAPKATPAKKKARKKASPKKAPLPPVAPPPTEPATKAE